MYTQDETRTPRVQQQAFLEFKFGFHELEVQRRNSSHFYYSAVYSAYITRDRLNQLSFAVSLDQQQCSSDKRFQPEFSGADTWKCDVSPTQFCLPNESWTLWTVSKGASIISTSQSSRHDSSHHDSMCVTRHHHPGHTCSAVYPRLSSSWAPRAL